MMLEAIGVAQQELRIVEKTKVVTILADDKSKQLEQKVNNLVNVYEKTYHQESVLVTYTKTDYSFI